MNIHEEIEKFGLTPDNTVVIGSGILNALNLRESKDIDVVITEEKYKEISLDDRFQRTEHNGKEIFVYGLLEAGTSCVVVGKTWRFEDLLPHSTMIDGVRYIDIHFLLDIKKWRVTHNEGRQKDIDDVRLMEEYLAKNV